MFARKFRAGIAVTALVASGLAIAGPALADPPSAPAPTAADFIAVGSDTSQFVVGDVATAYNPSHSSARLLSYDACTVASGTTYPCTPGGSITLPSGSITRPNGSGAGKALLYGTTNNTDVDFARSSSGLSTAETNAGLVAYPFAVDYMTTVVSGAATSAAPTALSIGQVLGIYNGTFTNWSQLGGANAPIHPFIPQTGSGTRTFFLAQLQAANGGVAPALASSVVETQEHDPTAIKNDPDAIAPFSRGRAQIANAGGATVRIENGWVAQRDLYNVVRGGLTSGDPLLTLVGSSGPFCDAANQTLIESDGFRQLDATACGAATITSASNYSVRGSSGVPTNQSSLSVTGGVRPYGTGSNAVINVVNGGNGFVSINGRGFAASAPVSGAQASIPLPANLPAGTYPITANYSGDSSHLGSTGTGSLTVTKANSGMSVSVKLTKVKKKKHHKAKKPTTYTATVRVSAAGVTPTGAVVIKKGSKTIGVGSVRNGVATIKFKITKLKKGKNKLTVTYLGDGNVNAVAKFVTVKRKK